MPGPITHRDYYDLNPPLGNALGDIWQDLPTFGLLRGRLSAGIVVTPACDLANRKAETITYLPVVGVLDLLGSVAFLPEVRRVLDGQWKVVSNEPLLVWPEGYRIPARDTVQAAQAIVGDKLGGTQLGAKDKASLERVAAALGVIGCLCSEAAARCDFKIFAKCLGESGLRETLGRIVMNSYRADLHFLPWDRQPAEWSGIKEHSVVLFRYPLTAPIEVFEAAQDISLADWGTYLKSIQPYYQLAGAFSGGCPTKRSSVKAPFISDLIARYVGLNVRLGSPDFTGETVSSLVGEIIGKREMI